MQNKPPIYTIKAGQPEIHDAVREEGAWIGEILGLVRPKLYWSIKQTESEII